MRAVQITRFGGLEVLDTVDLPEPTPGPGHQLYDVSTAGVNYADTHHRWASRMARRCCPELTGAGRFSRAISPRRTPYGARGGPQALPSTLGGRILIKTATSG
jgi:hypothetical protein